MEYSEEQVQDLLLLQRLYYGKVSQLNKQRQALLSRLTCSPGIASDGSNLPVVSSGNFSAFNTVATELQANAAEEHSVMMQCCCACFRGVSSTGNLP